jgi:hypothetical protein
MIRPREVRQSRVLFVGLHDFDSASWAGGPVESPVSRLTGVQAIQTVLERDGVKQEIRLEPSGIMLCSIVPDVAMSTVVRSSSLEVR